jgi:predicted nucleic acid-binding protein
VILLDTIIVSEPLKPNPEPRIIAWLDNQAIETLYLPSTGLAELLAGLERMPDGKRKRELTDGLTQLISTMIGPRVMAFDRQAAEVYSKRITKARSNGVIIALGDGQIGAIAAVHGFIVASRDTTPFVAMDVPVINPWNS